MKNKFIFIIITIFFISCFYVFYKGLNQSNIYIPQTMKEKNLPIFVAKDFYLGNEIDSREIFKDKSFYIINIWASWCLPCKKEHSILMKLSESKSIKLIGLNYKDNLENAKKFLLELGNPYSYILIDQEGIVAVEFGAYGIPETYIVDKDKKIIKKFIGPLNNNSLKEIKLITK
jgi:cytochrome c biogenesis protein CcmG/thiol:disulfide interchange protein DsbE|tara:strand:- start:1398 stop:1919 length:522 start_codon:yes stop_codon:yes gene_type:complete